MKYFSLFYWWRCLRILLRGYKIRIYFKSGNTAVFYWRKYNVKFCGDELTSLECEYTVLHLPRFIWMNLANIEAIVSE